MREGIRRLLEDHPDIEIVGVVGDRDAVIDAVGTLLPDVVLMDIKMPPTHTMEGVEAAHAVKARWPATGVVVQSQHDDEEYVWALLSDGVEGYGYLHKVRVGDIDQLVRAIEEVAAGGTVLDPRILATLIDRRSRKPGSRLAQLSAGELDVLRRMAEGASNAAIAAREAISVGTVEKRIAAIFTKLDLHEEADVNRRVAAVLLYLRSTGLGR
jgi:DNA-binding NarL/FixJ family response regulator